MTGPAAMTDLPYAFGPPAGTGTVKAAPEDFLVEEILGFEPSGEGEHVFLRIEKRGENTDYVARRLAAFARAPQRDVGYAGLKDRHGRTVQWFSVRVPVKTELDWRPLETETLRVLDVRRNARKLKKGAAAGNRFDITVRRLAGDRAEIERRLHRIAEQGVPNYFGAQRFGHDGSNIDRALALFAGTSDRIDPQRRGIYLSAARSLVFNRVLAARVADGTWDQAVPGDVFMFPDSRSFFKPEALTPDILQRVAEREIHPSGPLWGKGENPASDRAATVEAAAVADLAEICGGLERFGLDMARRQLRVCPLRMEWEFSEPDGLRLRFTLPAGAYATTVLRELIAADFPDGQESV
jgi:tRNA pseudouridine13 synthase